MVFNDQSSLIDPWKQPLDIVKPDGSHFTLSMEDINQFRKYTASLGINYGSQIGASLLLLLVLLLLTRADKRNSKIFIINVLCLVCNSIRCVLLSVYLTGTLWHPYSQAIGDFSRISGRDLANTTAANVFWMLVMILVMISLTVQVWTVCVTTVPKQRYIIVAVTGLMGLAATVMKAAVITLTIIQLHRRQTMDRYLYLHGHAYVLQGVSIWLYSLVFSYKLGYAIVQRRRLNMTQFGPMQVIFIGGCQTMLVPAIFTCFQFREDVPELGAQVLTVVCIFLPLSAIWAGVVNETIPASRAADSHHKLIQDQFYRVSQKSGASSHPSNNNTPEKSRQLSVCTCVSKTNATDSTDITPTTRRTGRDMYGEDSILIDREFGFTKEDADDRV